MQISCSSTVVNGAGGYTNEPVLVPLLVSSCLLVLTAL